MANLPEGKAFPFEQLPVELQTMVLLHTLSPETRLQIKRSRIAGMLEIWPVPKLHVCKPCCGCHSPSSALFGVSETISALLTRLIPFQVEGTVGEVKRVLRSLRRSKDIRYSTIDLQVNDLVPAEYDHLFAILKRYLDLPRICLEVYLSRGKHWNTEKYNNLWGRNIQLTLEPEIRAFLNLAKQVWKRSVGENLLFSRHYVGA